MEKEILGGANLKSDSYFVLLSILKAILMTVTT